MLLAALGVVAVALGGGGAGTFASFNAEVGNDNNIFATGTLFLHGKHGSNICRSEDNANNANVSCDILFNQSDLTAGAYASAQIELTNAGSINASTINLDVTCNESRPTVAQTTTPVPANQTYDSTTRLTLNFPSPLTQALVEGTDLIVTDGITSDTLTVYQTAASGSSSVEVTGTTDPSTAVNASVGTPASVEIAAFGNGKFCTTTGSGGHPIQFYVQETDSSHAAQECVVPAANTTCTAEDITSATAGTNNLLTNAWTSAGSAGTGALDAGKTRYYTVYVQIPPGTGVDNSTQNSQAKFNLDWTIAQ